MSDIPQTTLDKPNKNASTADWTAFALASGKTEADLDGLKRDQIAELFPDDENAGQTGDGNSAAVTPESAKQTSYEAGEAMTAKDAPAPVRAGAEELPPHLRAGAVHRAVTKK